MKIYSWNINGLRAVEKKGKLENFLQVENPDIACFQEIKIDGVQIKKENFDDKYPQYFKYYSHAERKGYAGTAIWSLTKPNAIITNFPDKIISSGELTDDFGDAASEGRICGADFGAFWLVCVYTPNTKNDLGRLPLRERWDKCFLDLVSGLEQGKFSAAEFGENVTLISENNDIFNSKPVLFCGDLNVAHEEIDLANPKQNVGKHGFTNEEREGFSEFIKRGFIDTFRSENPEAREKYTWWSHFAKSRERNVGWRIDYFMASKKPKFTFINPKIHSEIMGSDHCPISVETDNV